MHPKRLYCAHRHCFSVEAGSRRPHRNTVVPNSHGSRVASKVTRVESRAGAKAEVHRVVQPWMHAARCWMLGTIMAATTPRWAASGHRCPKVTDPTTAAEIASTSAAVFGMRRAVPDTP